MYFSGRFPIYLIVCNFHSVASIFYRFQSYVSLHFVMRCDFRLQKNDERLNSIRQRIHNEVYMLLSTSYTVYCLQFAFVSSSTRFDVCLNYLYVLWPLDDANVERIDSIRQRIVIRVTCCCRHRILFMDRYLGTAVLAATDNLIYGMINFRVCCYPR